MRQVRGLPSGDAVCYKCHVDKQGPFVYEHVPVKTEGCSSCHTPHGSTNPTAPQGNAGEHALSAVPHFLDPVDGRGASRPRAQSVGEISGLHHVPHADSWLQFQQCLFQVGSTDGAAHKTRPAIFATRRDARPPLCQLSEIGPPRLRQTSNSGSPGDTSVRNVVASPEYTLRPNSHRETGPGPRQPSTRPPNPMA